MQILADNEPLAALIANKAQDLETSGKEIQTAFANVLKTYQDTSTAILDLQNSTKSANRRCEDLQADIAALLQKIDTYEADTSVSDLRKKLDAFPGKLQGQSAVISVYKEKIKDCKAPDAVLLAGERVKSLTSLATQVDGKLEEIEDARTKLADQRKQIDKVAHDPRSFYSEENAVPLDVPTDIIVTVETRPLSDANAKFSQLGTWKLNFGGGPRFALAAGLSYTALEDRSFARVQAPSTTAGMTTNVIGLDRSSSGRATPLVILHTRLHTFTCLPTSLHLSFGLSGKIENSSTTAEYLAGVSFSAAEERLFLTVGGYYGGVQELEGNFKIGDTVPDTLTDVPVRKVKHWKLGFALSYKIR